MSTPIELLISCHTPFSKVQYRDVGGKGWNLFRLKRFGFRVPDWMIISSRLCDSVLEGERTNIEKLIEDTDFDLQESLQTTSRQIAAIIENSVLPLMFPIDLSIYMQKLFGAEEAFSVRSSVIGEDAQQNSYAGLMDSFLNIPPESIIAMMKKVWTSAFSPRALIYRHRKKLNLTDVSSAVIVQVMVHSKTSGILFTCNPDTGQKEGIITAGYGLGEGIVTNKVETDTYRIERNNGTIQKEIGVKKSQIDFTGNKGTQNCALAESLQNTQVLNDDQIRKLFDLGSKIENRFTRPQDIEWSFDRNDKLFILQTRPVIYSHKRPGQIRIWDNSNIVESYPGITQPLTFSFVRACYENIFRETTGSFLLLKSTLRGMNPIFKNMIGLLDGHVYYNLLNWYAMLSFLPGFKQHQQAWDQMIGLTQQTPFPQSDLSLLNKIYSWILVVWRLFTLRSNARHFFKRFDRIYQVYKEADLSHLNEDELINRYELLQLKLLGNWCRTLYNDFGTMKYYDWLKKICARWGLPGENNLHHDLLCGQKGMESVRPVHSLLDLGCRVRSQPTYLQLIETNTDKVVWFKIQTDRKYEELKRAVQLHLDKFGDRGIEELKLETPSLHEKPELLIAWIRQQCKINLSAVAMEAQEKIIRSRAEKSMQDKLKNPFKRLIYLFILHSARQAVANRENMRFARSRAYGLVRKIFQQVSIIFVQRGLLADKNDIFLLTMDEIFGIVRGTAVTASLRPLIESRKKEYAKYKHHQLAERIKTEGIPCLSGFTEDHKPDPGSTVLHGIGCSAGVARGKARIVLDPQAVQEHHDQILVAHSTDPGWVFLMISSKGMVVEKGSVLSHTAIIGRELGIPTIVGVKNATRLVPDGEMVCIDGGTGVLQWQ